MKAPTFLDSWLAERNATLIWGRDISLGIRFSLYLVGGDRKPLLVQSWVGEDGTVAGWETWMPILEDNDAQATLDAMTQYVDPSDES